MQTNENTLPFAAWNQSLSELTLEYAPQHGALFYKMTPSGLPCFTPKLLTDINSFQEKLGDFLKRQHNIQSSTSVNYIIHSSATQEIFNLGGDLGRFAELIRAKNREALSQYATACINVLHANHCNLGNQNITSIALLEGTAAGGGFEAALSSDVIIAERGVEMGFPEAIFNLFPGMGAFSFLTRRVSPTKAEQIIKSGRMYQAEEMYELGIIDELADPGEAKLTLQKYLKKHAKYANMHHAMKRVKDTVNPISYQELMDVTNIWVDAAMQLPESNVRTMERLVKAQNHRMVRQQEAKSM